MKTAGPYEINGLPLDRFSLIHFAAGVALAKLRVPFWATCAAAVGFEIVEWPLKERFPQAFPHPKHDRLINATTDCLAVLLGWRVGRPGV